MASSPAGTSWLPRFLRGPHASNVVLAGLLLAVSVQRLEAKWEADIAYPGRRTNSAFVFIKPHAVTDAAKALDEAVAWVEQLPGRVVHRWRLDHHRCVHAHRPVWGFELFELCGRRMRRRMPHRDG